MKSKKTTLIFFITLFFSTILLVLMLPHKKDNEQVKAEPDKRYVSQDVDVFGNPITKQNPASEKQSEKQPVIHTEVQEESELKVQFLDVGQADCILIQVDDTANILIDGGNNADGDDLVNYLRSIEVSHLDAIIATHPHEDHIGGLDDIMEGIPTDIVYMPDVPAKDKPGTKTYESFLDVIEEQGIPVVYPKNGDFIYNAGMTSLQVISPDEVATGNLNNYSIVTRLTHGSTTMIFTGDAEKEVNEWILKNYTSDFLKTDLLKVGHHGSRTSTTREWADILNPEYAVIMCGAGNDYGHPHKESLEYLKNSQIYRTDEDGTIICTSNGTDLYFQTKCTGNVPFGE